MNWPSTRRRTTTRNMRSIWPTLKLGSQASNKPPTPTLKDQSLGRMPVMQAVVRGAVQRVSMMVRLPLVEFALSPRHQSTANGTLGMEARPRYFQVFRTCLLLLELRRDRSHQTQHLRLFSLAIATLSMGRLSKVLLGGTISVTTAWPLFNNSVE